MYKEFIMSNEQLAINGGPKRLPEHLNVIILSGKEIEAVGL